MIPEIVKQAVAAAFADVDATIGERTPEVHQSNELFELWVKDRHFIVKHFLKEEEWATAPAAEHASLQLLLPLDIAPRPHFYDPAIGPVVIYEYMEGRMWGRYRPSVEELQGLALAIAEIHSLPSAGLWLARGSEKRPEERMLWFQELLDSYAVWSESAFPAGQEVVALCRRLIEESGIVLRRLYETPQPMIFCRSDPRFANVIMRPDGRLGFVDWEDAGLRDPALELADLSLHMEQEDLLTRDVYEAFLATYCQRMGRDVESLALRIQEYSLVLPVFYLLILMRYGVGLGRASKLAKWQINELPANLRLQRYLARAFSRSQWEFNPAAYADVIFFPTE